MFKKSVLFFSFILCFMPNASHTFFEEEKVCDHTLVTAGVLLGLCCLCAAGQNSENNKKQQAIHNNMRVPFNRPMGNDNKNQ